MTNGRAEISLREGRTGDLARRDRLWHESKQQDPPPTGQTSPIFAHELSTGRVVIAEQGERLVGLASALTRGDVTYLAELAVAADVQGRRIARELMAAVLPSDTRERCTLSSEDRRAVALYARAGMTPRWPVYLLHAEQFDPAALAGRVAAVSADPADPAILEWDVRVSGRPRPEDLAFLADAGDAQPVWLQSDGTTVGYAFIQRQPVDSLSPLPDDYFVGPLGVDEPDQAAACAAAAVGWAQQRGASVSLGVPALNPALAPLLEIGFRIRYGWTFCTSRDDTCADPRTYLPAQGVLY